MSRRLKAIFDSNPARLVYDLLLVYAGYLICRLIFIYEASGSAQVEWGSAAFMRILWGGLRFDTSAIFYTNIPVILLYLLPWKGKETRGYHLAVRIIYIVVNGFAFLLNFADSVLFEYRHERITTATFREFSNEDNIFGLAMAEVASHWYLVVFLAAMIWALWRFYAPARLRYPSVRAYYWVQSVSLAVFGAVTVMGMRGSSFFVATRPIAVSTAHQYVDDAVQTALVLNTPFSIIRTLRQIPSEVPVYFASQEEVDAIYSPVHYPDTTREFTPKNVVIIIVESFAQEFVGGLNRDLDGGAYRGYTPFVDSLLNVATYFEQSFANTDFSIDAPPAVLASIPRMEKPFVLTPASLHRYSSIAGELAGKGYRSAFFHGADNESLGFNAFVKSVGFDDYFGMQEYVADPRTGGRGDFDGHWGIWDEEFLRYFCLKLGEMPQPFVAAVFTLTSHHPFAIPDKYKDVFKDEGQHLLHKCIRYTDYSLRQFFADASRQPWFRNTVFVITADHASSKRTHDVYKTRVGDFRVPIIFYDPSGGMPAGRQKGIVQQIDIMPTLLGYLGYDRPFVSFGKDMFATPPGETWAFNWVHYPQYIKGDYLLRTDLDSVTAVYNYVADPLLQHNLKGRFEGERQMERELRAILQQITAMEKTGTKK